MVEIILEKSQMKKYPISVFKNWSFTKKVRTIYKLSRQIEFHLESLDKVDLEADVSLLSDLKKYVSWISGDKKDKSDPIDWFFLKVKLDSVKDLKSFYEFIVPIERYLQNSVKDGDFLVSCFDRSCASKERLDLSLVLVDLRSSFNVGNIIRTFDALNGEEILFCGYTPYPDLSSFKSAMGAEKEANWKHFLKVDEVFHYLKSQKKSIIALETVPSTKHIYEFVFPESCALVLGNERFGLNQNILEQADQVIQIPVFGVKNSLNVGVSFAIAGFELLRQKRFNKLIDIKR